MADNPLPLDVGVYVLSKNNQHVGFAKTHQSKIATLLRVL